MVEILSNRVTASAGQRSWRAGCGILYLSREQFNILTTGMTSFPNLSVGSRHLKGKRSLIKLLVFRHSSLMPSSIPQRGLRKTVNISDPYSTAVSKASPSGAERLVKWRGHFCLESFPSIPVLMTRGGQTEHPKILPCPLRPLEEKSKGPSVPSGCLY